MVVRQALLQARERTLHLAEDFEAALGSRPQVPHAAELNPPLWELGHVAWFQEWWIARNPQRDLGARADPTVERAPSLLPGADAWYDSSRVAHDRRWELPLPTAAATRAYLQASLQRTLQLLDALPLDADDAALYFFRLTALHEQMHAEAAVYMGHSLGMALRESREPLSAGARKELQVAGGRFTLGAREPGFAFDNELGVHEVELAPFTIDAEPVTWDEVLPWLATLGDQHPAGLRRSADGWEQLRHGRWHLLRPQEVAVHLSAHDADAWCRWAGRRLPSEAEWECAALTQPDFRWGHAWEWTASHFEPYPGFVPHPYRDYSQPWFGSRRVLRGASPATAPVLAHARYRNFFEPHRRDIFAGFRSVRAGDGPKRSAV